MTVENTQALADQSAYLNVLRQAGQLANVTSSQAQKFSDTMQKIQVKAGDTVSQLASEYGTTTARIVQANNLADPNFIMTGQSLLIPGKDTVLKTANTATKATQTIASSAASTSSATSINNNESQVEAEARAWIVQRESGGSYTARNGKYIGKYQLDQSYLNGDYSAANQEKVANNYVKQRYGSWVNAKKHWEAFNWY